MLDKEKIDVEVVDEKEKAGVSLVMAIVMSFLASVICLGFYHFVTAKKPTQFAMVDVQSITSAFENQARATIVDNVNATDADREVAANEFEAKMRSLQSVIAKVGVECDCVLLVKAAVLNAKNSTIALKDYTPIIAEQMGVQVGSKRPVAETAPVEAEITKPSVDAAAGEAK